LGGQGNALEITNSAVLISGDITGTRGVAKERVGVFGGRGGKVKGKKVQAGARAASRDRSTLLVRRLVQYYTFSGGCENQKKKKRNREAGRKKIGLLILFQHQPPPSVTTLTDSDP